jgi:hypothetical protein
MTHMNLPFCGQHFSWHVVCFSPICNTTHNIVMFPVYIAIVCPQVPGYVDFTATTIYSFASRGPAAGGSYSYPCGLPT